MSEPTPPAPVPGAHVPAKRNTWKYTLGLVALILAGGAGYYFYVKSQNPEPPPVDELSGLKEYLVRLSGNQKLAAGYADADPKDMVADAPKEPAKWAKVEGELTFTVVGTDDPEKAAAEWKDFMTALGTATNKKVVYLADVGSVDDQLAAVRDGRLHVTAFNTGAVPTAVNTAGFVPLFAPADAAGKYRYEMEILVRKDSPAQTPADLKGKTVGFVALSSNSGAKAPLVAFKGEFGMLPGRDYKYAITGDHKRSIHDLIGGKHDAVCVANDLLAREVTAGVAADSFRSVYRSKPFPPLCFGVPHHLPPDVRAQLSKAFTDFRFAGNSVGARYTPQGKTQFAAVSYEKDWEYVRQIDAALARLLDEK